MIKLFSNILRRNLLIAHHYPYLDKYASVRTMSKIIECVPNFSEGRNKAVIEAIGKSIEATPGCTLLNVEPGASTNRTVYTFLGAPDSVVEGALAASRVARRDIDMREQSGEHPRIGALDVCPFIPVRNATFEDCISCSKIFGQRLSEELGVPVYLYELSQELAYRKKLEDIRKGEYEQLPSKLGKEKWKPDFGSVEFVPEWGATVAGARKFLIAYNVNLLGTKEQAHRIALNIRESGRGPGEEGLFKEVRAIGWKLEEADLAQVSVNLGDWQVTNLHTVFEECKRQAAAMKLSVAGSELIGLIPLSAVLNAADFYIQQDDLFILEEEHKVRLVVDRVGLHSISPFEPNKRILEYMLTHEPAPLLSMSLREFIQSVGARSPLPGGGCVAALVSSLGAALGSMYGLLSYGQRKYEQLDPLMRECIPVLRTAYEQLMALVQEDSDAFESILKASRMKKDTQEESAKRGEAMQVATKRAIDCPLQVMKVASRCWEPMLKIAAVGNAQALSDLQVGAKALEFGLWGASRNVEANLPALKDEQFSLEAKQLSARLSKEGQEYSERIIKIVADRLSK